MGWEKRQCIYTPCSRPTLPSAPLEQQKVDQLPESAPATTPAPPPPRKKSSVSEPKQASERTPVPEPSEVAATEAEDLPGLRPEEEATVVNGNIHDPRFRAFWRNEFRADDYILRILEESYKFQFTEKPTQYREKNNKSTRENMEFVRDAVAKLVKSGVVVESATQPFMCAPLSVAKREKSDGSVKLRLCYDASRHLNKLIKKESLHYPTVESVAELMNFGSWLASYDFSSAFYHVRIHPAHQEYLGFALEEEDESGEKTEKFYKYTVMCFGASCAPFVLYRVTRPLRSFLSRAGIPNTLFMDDGFLVGNSREEVLKMMSFVWKTCESAGFVLSPEKCTTEKDVSQSVKYIGFIFDSLSMTISVDEDKMAACKEKLEDLISATDGGKTRSAREVASAVGTVVSMTAGIGQMGLLMVRRTQSELSRFVEAHSWSRHMLLSKEASEDLFWLHKELSSLNGQPIKRLDKAEVLQTLPRILSDDEKGLLVSDASAHGCCVLEFDMHQKPTEMFFQALLSEEEKSLSSGHRELLAVCKCLERKGHALKKGMTYFWLTDSTNLVTFMEKGSMKMHIQEDVLRAYKRIREIGIRLEFIHVRRSDPRIELADSGSRNFDQSDWSITRSAVDWLAQQVEKSFSVDLFATAQNTHCKRFFAPFVCAGAVSIDAFAQDWSRETWVYACPPVKDVLKAFRKMEREKAQGVLVFPRWLTTSFWAVMFPDGSHAVSCQRVIAFKPYIHRGDYCAKTMLGGVVYSFVALVFDKSIMDSPDRSRCAFNGCSGCQ